MAVDIRATVTCSLGTLISGSLSDDYIQGSGLVKTRGSVEISGTLTPAIGTAVTFSYVKGGVTRSIPRKLRVLSSFADPFRRTTKVELGCKLTYLSDLKPAPSVNGNIEAETGKRRECLNGYIDFSKNTQFGIPLIASDLANECLSKLGITLASPPMPLTSKFYRDSFDLTSGYVNVLNDLLLSESYCGYLNEQEQLVLLDLTQDSGAGPVYTSSDIVDLSGINTGGLPGDAVVVRYESVELKEDLENADQQVIDQRGWTTDEVIGDKQKVYVRYTTGDGATYTNTYTYIPYTKTITEYGEDNSWDDTTCVLVSTAGEGADLSNTVVKRTTRKNVLKAEAANDYCAQLLSEGIDPAGATQAEVVVVEKYEYDSDGQLTRQITTTTEPFFAWAGRLGMEFVYDNPGVQSRVSVVLDNTPVITSKVITDITTLYADLPRTIKLEPGETYKRLVNGQKTVTTTYTNWALTQSGEQGTAGIRTVSTFNTVEECTAYLDLISLNLVISDTTIQTSRDRILVGIERRPAIELRMGDRSGARGEFTSELLYVTGSPLAQRIVEFSLPYAPDDTRSSLGAVVKGNAKEIANRYGRVQNRLLLGNRNGVNLQLAPEKLPAAPFAPMYVQANGLTALYRANGNQWAFSSDGIVCSTDALFWAAVGGTGTFWFPVAPGITSLPSTPPVVDGQMNATSTVLPYNETAVYDSRIRLITSVTKFAYSLDLLTVVPTSVVKVPAVVRKIRAINVPNAVVITTAAAVPVVSGGSSVNSPLASIAVAAVAPTVISVSNGINVPTVNISISAISPAVGSPDPYFNSVSMLLHMNGANGSTAFTDNSLNALTINTYGNALISTTQSKFGGASGYFDGTSNTYVETNAGGTLFDFANDFTVEFWLYWSDNTGNQAIYDSRAAGFSHFLIGLNDPGANQIYLYGSNGASNAYLVQATVTTATWQHVAFSRSSGTLRLFIDGTQQASVANSVSFATSTTGRPLIGRSRFGIAHFKGYLDEMRVTKGVARYTTSFTPPTAAFPNS